MNSNNFWRTSLYFLMFFEEIWTPLWIYSSVQPSVSEYCNIIMAVNILETMLKAMRDHNQMVTNIYWAPSLCRKLLHILSYLISQQLCELSVCSYSYFGEEETESKALKHRRYFPRSHTYKIKELTSTYRCFYFKFNILSISTRRFWNYRNSRYIKNKEKISYNKSSKDGRLVCRL